MLIPIYQGRLSHDLNIQSCENIKFWSVLFRDVCEYLGQPPNFGVCVCTCNRPGIIDFDEDISRDNVVNHSTLMHNTHFNSMKQGVP
jgi:hypothetical protein